MEGYLALIKEQREENDKLQQENDRLKEENERLNNIINELKDWIKNPKNQNSSDGYQVVYVDELLKKIG